MRQLLAFAFSSALALTACDGCEKKPEGTPPDAAASVAPAKPDAMAAAVADASAPASERADAGTSHHMANCPTAGAGAEVAIKDIEGGVEVTVTGKDDATIRDIRERARKLSEADNHDAGNAQKHDHAGSGGGMTGRCTIIMRSTKVLTAEIPNGSKFTVTAKEKNEVDWVRRETRDRDKEAKSAGAAGAGALRMTHCPSAVEGAKTSVKDSKEGAIITVTAVSADKVADIKARAKHTANVAKKNDSAKVEHSGEGTGNGAVGRCPVVVEGDTTVDVKDIEGGVEVEVKTKKDVPALQKEVKARAANFGAK